MDDKTMSFGDHLEELRWVVFKAVIALGVGTAAGFLVTSVVYNTLALPLERIDSFEVKLVFAGPLDAFLIRIKLAVLAGIVFSLPFVIKWVWEFVSPGLREREIRAAWGIAGGGSVLFVCGMGFGYLTLFYGLPALVGLGIQGTRAEHLWSLQVYLNFCLRLLLAFGVVFELPVVTVLLCRTGLVTRERLAAFRPHALLAAVCLAAFLTPPDPYTQLMLALPLYLLFELSMLVGKLFDARAA